MQKAAGKFIKLILYSAVLFVVIAILIHIFHLQITIPHLLLTLFIFTTITALALVVFLIGTDKSTEKQPLFTIGGLGLKFLLSILYAIIYFAVLKNTGTIYIILFFLLYLAFTIYLLRNVVKILKFKSLK